MLNTETKIAVVVVTFNRKDMVFDCLNGIMAQTKKVDRVFVIDNASTDGTGEIMKERYANSDSVVYTRLDKNEGCTGGFHEGVKAAYEWGADWIWFLDDDIAPAPTCLEELLKYEHISKCIHPSKTDVHGNEFIWESVFDPATGAATFMNNISFKHGKDFTFVNIGCFEGMLIHRDVVKEIGFPDKRFFITGDDTAYGFLASLYTNVIYVKSAMINKLIPFSHRISPAFLYYAVRNQFLVKEYLKKYKLYNKRLFNVYLTLFILSACTKQLWRNKKISTIRYVFKGLRDGMRGKFYKLS